MALIAFLIAAVFAFFALSPHIVRFAEGWISRSQHARVQGRTKICVDGHTLVSAGLKAPTNLFFATVERKGERRVGTPGLWRLRWDDVSGLWRIAEITRYSREQGLKLQYLNGVQLRPTASTQLAAAAGGMLAGEAAGEVANALSLDQITTEIAKAGSDEAAQEAILEARKRRFKVSGLFANVSVPTSTGRKRLELIVSDRDEGRFEHASELPKEEQNLAALTRMRLVVLGAQDLAPPSADAEARTALFHAEQRKLKSLPAIDLSANSLDMGPEHLLVARADGTLSSLPIGAGAVDWLRMTGRVIVSVLVGAVVLIAVAVARPDIGAAGPSDRQTQSEAAAEARPARPAQFVQVVTSGNRLMLRAEPDTQSTILERLQPGTVLLVCGRGEGWLRVATADRRGHVAARYTRPVSEESASAALREASCGQAG